MAERELIKLAALSCSLAEALRRRGVPDTAAELVAQTGVTILTIAMTRWIDDPAERPWEFHVGDAVSQLHWLTAPTSDVGA